MKKFETFVFWGGKKRILHFDTFENAQKITQGMDYKSLPFKPPQLVASSEIQSKQQMKPQVVIKIVNKIIRLVKAKIKKKN